MLLVLCQGMADVASRSERIGITRGRTEWCIAATARDRYSNSLNKMLEILQVLVNYRLD